MRKYYQRRLPSDSSKDYYYLLRDTPNNETLIVEYGFADSTGDDVSILKNNWQDLAEAVVRALATYIGVPYSSTSTGGNYYTVKKGDTLWNIANANNISVNELKQANNLTSNSLSIGQLLKIPSKEVSSSPENTYTVKAGDSLYKIANQYQTTIAALKELNNLSSNTLQIGQILKLPSSTNVPNNNNVYTVVSGDSLYRIAQRFGVTVDAIMRANNLSNSNLSIGQKLVIPTSTSNQVYTVKAGDSLYRIAQQFNTTAKAIQDLNNLNTTLLSIGQKLLIP